jgi:hypothetical protein
VSSAPPVSGIDREDEVAIPLGGLRRTDASRQVRGGLGCPAGAIYQKVFKRSAQIFANVNDPGLMFRAWSRGSEPSVSKTSPTWLIDKSAYARLGRGPDDQVWADRIDRGPVAHRRRTQS